MYSSLFRNGWYNDALQLGKQPWCYVEMVGTMMSYNLENSLDVTLKWLIQWCHTTWNNLVVKLGASDVLVLEWFVNIKTDWQGCCSCKLLVTCCVSFVLAMTKVISNVVCLPRTDWQGCCSCKLLVTCCVSFVLAMTMAIYHGGVWPRKCFLNVNKQILTVNYF